MRTVTIILPPGYVNANEFAKDCEFELVEPQNALADELQRLCCAETEGKFFDCVTENIDNILAALRATQASK